jgi:ribosomal protein S18 acetylase RimI-like enzyme
MPSILHFRKQLTAPPVAADVPGIRVRTFILPDDIAPWLILREHATSDLTSSVRTWSVHDFRTEMETKPWWRPDHTWLAIAGDLWSPDTSATIPATRRSPASDPHFLPNVVGAVTLALREGATVTIPVIHWLLVDPAYRRRGIARSLLNHLETAAWESGYREVQLETHANWRSAVALYQSIGYAPLRDRSPR